MTRHLAIGDVHGCATALRTLEAFVGVRPGDVVVPLGDYVDRGPDSRGVLDWLIGFESRHPGASLVPLRGNHEVMLLAARHGDAAAKRTWLACGGAAALASYAVSGGRPSLDDVPEEHWAFLEERLVAFHEADGHFFVHANAYPDCPLAEQPDFMLYWESWHGSPPRHESGKIMVTGHTPQRTGLPRVTPYAVCLDTGACRGNWLSCLCVETGELWQADERGRTRKMWLDEV